MEVGWAAAGFALKIERPEALKREETAGLKSCNGVSRDLI
jgi:hypothetical protein